MYQSFRNVPPRAPTLEQFELPETPVTKTSPKITGSPDVSDDVTRTKVTGKVETIDHHIGPKLEKCAPKGTDARAEKGINRAKEEKTQKMTKSIH